MEYSAKVFEYGKDGSLKCLPRCVIDAVSPKKALEEILKHLQKETGLPTSEILVSEICDKNGRVVYQNAWNDDGPEPVAVFCG